MNTFVASNAWNIARSGKYYKRAFTATIAKVALSAQVVVCHLSRKTLI